MLTSKMARWTAPVLVSVTNGRVDQRLGDASISDHLPRYCELDPYQLMMITRP
jgi:hypothetical protein